MKEVSEELKENIIKFMYPGLKPDRIYETCTLFHCYFDANNTSNSINKTGLYKTLFKEVLNNGK